MEEEKNGVSLSDIFKTIWSQKWLALIIAAVILIAGTLGLHYGYGAIKEEYTSTFSINVQVNSDGFLLYPDGTARNYRDFTSSDNLKAVKALNEDFSGINVEKMYKKSDISISQSKTDSGAYIYKLSVKAKYFPSSDVASSFLNEIASTPSKEIYKWVGGLSDNMAVAFETKLGNELKLDYLKTQLNNISSRFNKLGGLSNASKDKLNDCLLELTALTGELHTAYYEPSVAALQNYKYLIKGLENNIEATNKVLEGLQQGSTVTQDVAQLIESYSLKAAELEQQKNAYHNYLEKAGCASGDETTGYVYTVPETITESDPEGSANFTKNLNALLAKVQSLTAVDESNYYKNTSLISYEGAQIKTENDIGLIKSAVISLVAGLVIALLVAYIVGYVKANKTPANTAAETAAPAETEQSTEQTGQN